MTVDRSDPVKQVFDSHPNHMSFHSRLAIHQICVMCVICCLAMHQIYHSPSPRARANLDEDKWQKSGGRSLFLVANTWKTALHLQSQRPEVRRAFPYLQSSVPKVGEGPPSSSFGLRRWKNPGSDARSEHRSRKRSKRTVSRPP